MCAISIVIPVLDDAEPLARLLPELRAAAATTASRIEVIVVDGGSRDASLEVAGQHADRVRTTRPGRANQLAEGIAVADGSMVWMLHADSIVGAEHLRVLNDLLTRGRHRWGRFDVRLDADGVLFRLIETGMNVRSRLTAICTGDQGIFARRDMLDAVGGVPRQALMEDVELSKRLRRLGRPFCARESLTTSARRWQTNGVLTTVSLMWLLRIRYFLGADPTILARRYYPESARWSPLDAR
jgi:rSAM/selenodomain-associated transferase 2